MLNHYDYEFIPGSDICLHRDPYHLCSIDCEKYVDFKEFDLDVILSAMQSQCPNIKKYSEIAYIHTLYNSGRQEDARDLLRTHINKVSSNNIEYLYELLRTISNIDISNGSAAYVALYFLDKLGSCDLRELLNSCYPMIRLSSVAREIFVKIINKSNIPFSIYKTRLEQIEYRDLLSDLGF